MMSTDVAPLPTRAGRADRIVRWAAVAVSVLALGHLALGAFAPAQSHFVLAGSIPLATSAMWVLRLVVATGAALCFLLGPGLVWRRARPDGLLDNLAFVWIPGALYLCAVGGVAWWVAHWIDPSLTCALLLLPVPLAVLWCTRNWSNDVVRSGESTAIVLFLLVFAIGLGVSVWSLGPEGELYGGTISRTLEAGPRSDSRISFNVIALLAHGDSPYGERGTFYYAPYNFYARGPVAGLAAGALVMAGGAAPQRGYPDAPWEPFDREGFMTYRIVMMLLNATAILSVFGLAATFLRRRLAVAVAALVALSPFVVYEVYFTWPKLLAASYVVAAAVALLRGRRVLAGLLLGLAYLAHPSALFAVPAVLLAWLVLRERGTGTLPVTDGDEPEACAMEPGFLRWCLDSLVVAVSLGVVYLGWRALNAGHTVDYFNNYLSSAYGKVDAPVGDWIRFRLHLTANSFIPFRQVFADPHDEFTNVAGGQSPFIVRVATEWRSTVTVAVGVLYLPMFLYGFARFARRAVLLTLALFVVPTVAFIVFWGANSTGVLQEGLHALFLFSLVAAFVGHTALPHSRLVGRWVQVSATARVLEVLFIVMVPTIATTGLLSSTFRVTDVLAVTLVVASALGLALISWRAFTPERVAAIAAPD
jgi:hypothetical protein